MTVSVATQICEMKKQMVHVAEEHDFNFHHPEVVEISQQLDRLIVAAMQKQQPIQN